MEVKDLNEALEGLKGKLETSTKAQIETALEGLKGEFINEEKMNGLVGDKLVQFKSSLEAEYKAAVKEVQEHANKLDQKLKGKDVQANAKKGVIANIKSAVKDNFDGIKDVRKGKSIQVKAVGDMTTANLTGDEHRDYNFDVVMLPSQKVNVSDLVGSVNISGGTYTYIRETGSEGAIGAQTEGANKSQIDYDLTSIDVATDFIAGFARYSKKMKNNLPYLESFVPKALRRDYMKAENSAFYTVLAADATASTEIITGKTKVEMLVNEAAKLEDADYEINAHVVRPSDWYDILKLPKDQFAAIVSFEGGVLRVNGIPVVKATWLPANKYFSGDWSRVNKINTEGLSLEFSSEEGSNFVQNNITARIESQTALAVERPAALVFGDFTAI